MALRLYPRQPPKAASRLERLAFLRKNYYFSIAVIVPLLVICAVISTFFMIVCIVGLVLQLGGLAVVLRQERAERRRIGR
jgi:hypothetical protein